jgi:hypothetical protein
MGGPPGRRLQRSPESTPRPTTRRSCCARRRQASAAVGRSGVEAPTPGRFRAADSNRWSGFAACLDPFLRFGQTVTIRVECRAHEDSRWYAGSGITRPTCWPTRCTSRSTVSSSRRRTSTPSARSSPSTLLLRTWAARPGGQGDHPRGRTHGTKVAWASTPGDPAAPAQLLRRACPRVEDGRRDARSTDLGQSEKRRSARVVQLVALNRAPIPAAVPPFCPTSMRCGPPEKRVRRRGVSIPDVITGLTIMDEPG